MSVTVVTGWHPAGWRQYGRLFVDKFAKHWPNNIRMFAYVEEHQILPRGQCVSLWDIDGAREFLDRNSDIPERCGRKPVERWKPKEIAAGYSFRFDACKFFKQCLIPWDAAQLLTAGDILVWLDADVVTFRDIPVGFVDQLIGDADICYLGRGPKHSEIGFWAVRINRRSLAFLEAFADAYRNDTVFQLPEWHSAFVFDHCRRKAEANGLIGKDLTPGGNGHVWFQSPLGNFTDHCKGDRKGRGSRECPVKWWV